MKAIALFLVCIMLASCLAACGKANTKATVTTGSEKATSEFSEINEYVSVLANEFNFNGDTFTVIGKESDHCQDEEIKGNLENDALYSRMRGLEEAFGITYEYAVCDGENYDSSPSLEVTAKVEADVMSGLGAYDAIHSNIMVGGQVMLASGLLQPVEELPGIDLGRSWWINDIESQFGIGGHLFFLTGKIVVDNYWDASCILFNKQIADDFNITGLYDTVKSGEWTVDKMAEVASAIPADGNIFRMSLGNYEDGLGFYFAGGFSICETDAEGNLSIPASLSNAQVNWIDKLAGIFGDGKAYYIASGRGDDEGAPGGFEKGDVFMAEQPMSAVSTLREKDIEFGILPMPKRDTDQKDYISYSRSMNVCSYTVSKVAKNTEKTGVLLEAMAALSEKYLEPAYYEKALKGRGTYDTDSREMLDLIYATKKVDYAATYQWGNLWEIIDDAVTCVNESYVSDYAGSSRFANKKVEQLVNKIRAEN